MAAFVHGRDVYQLLRNAIQPVAVRVKCRVDQVRIDRDEERPVTVFSGANEVHGLSCHIPVALVEFPFPARIDAEFLGGIGVHHRVLRLVQRFEEVGHAVHHGVPARQVVHVLAEQQQVVRLPQTAVIGPHAGFQSLEVAPALAGVGVGAGEHVRARRTADGIGAVGVAEQRALGRQAVDVGGGTGHRRVALLASEQTPVPALGVKLDDVVPGHGTS